MTFLPQWPPVCHIFHFIRWHGSGQRHLSNWLRDSWIWDTFCLGFMRCFCVVIVRLFLALFMREWLPKTLPSPTAMTHPLCDVKLHNQSPYHNLNISPSSWHQNSVSNGREKWFKRTELEAGLWNVLQVIRLSYCKQKVWLQKNLREVSPGLTAILGFYRIFPTQISETERNVCKQSTA